MSLVWWEPLVDWVQGALAMSQLASIAFLYYFRRDEILALASGNGCPGADRATPSSALAVCDSHMGVEEPVK